MAMYQGGECVSVLPGSVLRPVLYGCCINDGETGVKRMLMKLTGAIKFGGDASSKGH